MWRKTGSLIAAGLFAAAAGAGELRAQDEVAGGFGIGVNGGYYDLGGDDFAGTEGSFGAEATLRWLFPSGFGIGVGGGWASYGDEVVDEDVDRISLYVAPRYDVRLTGSRLTPYIEGRVGYARLSAEDTSGAVDLEVSANGFEAGAVAGLEIPIGRAVALDLSVLFQYLSFGDLEVNDVTVEGTDSSGTEFGLRGGLSILFP